MNPMNVDLNNFTRLIDENKKRVFYYETDRLIELYFFIETIPIKTIVDKSTIEQPDVFRGHKMFFGSISLTKPLFDPQNDNILNLVGPHEGGDELGLMNLSKPEEEQRQDSEEHIEVKETPKGDVVKSE